MRNRMPRRIAVMGGAYGNLSALEACLADARAMQADTRAFLGDSIGCCGHSNEVVAMIRSGFDVFVAGNHEQQAVAGSKSCGCGYSSADDEKISCEAFEIAVAALSEESRQWLSTWPNHTIVELEGGSVLLCHGSPGYTSEFLYEAELDDLRFEAWLDHFGVNGPRLHALRLALRATCFAMAASPSTVASSGKPITMAIRLSTMRLIELSGRAPNRRSRSAASSTITSDGRRRWKQPASRRSSWSRFEPAYGRAALRACRSQKDSGGCAAASGPKQPDAESGSRRSSMPICGDTR